MGRLLACVGGLTLRMLEECRRTRSKRCIVTPGGLCRSGLNSTARPGICTPFVKVLLVVTLVRGVSVLGRRPDIAARLPRNFAWGLGVTAYPSEGGWGADGKVPSIWDDYVDRSPGQICGNGTGANSTDFYNRHLDDVALAASLGADSFHLSIAWSRVMLEGGSPNEAGIFFYNTVLNDLQKRGMAAYVTLFAWDTPLWLSEASHLGWTNPALVTQFVSYADLCFSRFGDRVAVWFTMDDPATFARRGYEEGTYPPGFTDSGVTVAHYLLVAHAGAVALYRKKYAAKQRGQVSIILDAPYVYPRDPTSPSDMAAADAALVLGLGHFAYPVVYGDYPALLKQSLGATLPKFRTSETTALNGSIDFFAMKHSTSSFATFANSTGPAWPLNITLWPTPANETPAAYLTDDPDSWAVPTGIRAALGYVHGTYGLPIWVMENGVAVPNEASLPAECAVQDTFRVAYLHDYLLQLALAVQQDQVPVQGYFPWSFTDDFEWTEGYCRKTGLVRVDFAAPSLTRTPKLSASWLQSLIRLTRGEDGDGTAVYDVGDDYDFGQCPSGMAKGWYIDISGDGSPDAEDQAAAARVKDSPNFTAAEIAALSAAALIGAAVLFCFTVVGVKAVNTRRAAATSRVGQRMASEDLEPEAEIDWSHFGEIEFMDSPQRPPLDHVVLHSSNVLVASARPPPMDPRVMYGARPMHTSADQ